MGNFSGGRQTRADEGNRWATPPGDKAGVVLLVREIVSRVYNGSEGMLVALCVAAPDVSFDLMKSFTLWCVGLTVTSLITSRRYRGSDSS